MKQMIGWIAGLALIISATGISAQEIALTNGKYVTPSGAPYTGELLSYREDGSLKSAHQVVDGILEGEVVFYAGNGVKEEVGSYKGGQKHGVWKQFNASGAITGEAWYVNGEKDGVWTVWDDQGVKRYHMVYSMGRKVDTWQIFDENANLVSERIYGE
jgi:antitoxin component YwqK of YwqJK toxin-antitoxin module